MSFCTYFNLCLRSGSGGDKQGVGGVGEFRFKRVYVLLTEMWEDLLVSADRCREKEKKYSDVSEAPPRHP